MDINTAQNPGGSCHFGSAEVAPSIIPGLQLPLWLCRVAPSIIPGLQRTYRLPHRAQRDGRAPSICQFVHLVSGPGIQTQITCLMVPDSLSQLTCSMVPDMTTSSRISSLRRSIIEKEGGSHTCNSASSSVALWLQPLMFGLHLQGALVPCLAQAQTMHILPSIEAGRKGCCPCPPALLGWHGVACYCASTQTLPVSM